MIKVTIGETTYKVWWSHSQIKVDVKGKPSDKEGARLTDTTTCKIQAEGDEIIREFEVIRNVNDRPDRKYARKASFAKMASTIFYDNRGARTIFWREYNEMVHPPYDVVNISRYGDEGVNNMAMMLKQMGPEFIEKLVKVLKPELEALPL